MFPTELVESGLADTITVRFVAMRGDLLAVTDPDAGVIYLRVDAPLEDAHAAWVRETRALVHTWGLTPDADREAEVVELYPEESHGVG